MGDINIVHLRSLHIISFLFFHGHLFNSNSFFRGSDLTYNAYLIWVLFCRMLSDYTTCLLVKLSEKDSNRVSGSAVDGESCCVGDGLFIRYPVRSVVIHLFSPCISYSIFHHFCY